MTAFTSSLEEEIVAVLETVKWLEKNEAKHKIPRHYRLYLTNLANRVENFQNITNRRIGAQND